MHALGQLIEDCKAANDWTNGDIARRSGGRIASRSRVQQLIHDPIKAMPTLKVVEGLAVGLGVPEWVIVDSALESMGFPHRPARVSLDEAIEADRSLPEADKAALRGFIAHLRRSRLGERDLGAARPDNMRYLYPPVEHVSERPRVSRAAWPRPDPEGKDGSES